jgi:hypothetical protein
VRQNARPDLLRKHAPKAMLHKPALQPFGRQTVDPMKTAGAGGRNCVRIDISAKDRYRGVGAVGFNCLLQQDRDGINLFARRAAGNPDPDGIVGFPDGQK